jgi:hypothetical protein
MLVLGFGPVTRKLKFLVVFAMLVLVPLRSLAAVTVGLCATGEGGTAAAELVAHHHGAAGDETSSDGDTRNSSLACSLCTACCTGASFAPDAPLGVRVAGADLERIPFFGRDPGTPHPDSLERPPLSR